MHKMIRKNHKKSTLMYFLYTILILFAGCGTQNVMPTIYTGQPIETVQDTQDSVLEQAETPSSQEEPTVSMENHENQLPHPGIMSLENFLKTAILPLGNTMYVWGGGWNEEDTGAGPEAVSLGVSPRWKEFADAQTSSYDHQTTRYHIHDGLDCSGFVGWAVYNVMETESGRKGYVMKSTETARTYASYGWGDFLEAGQVQDHLPGDIMSMKGHVWICLGTCEDGSVLLLHSSPPGVRICGTSGVNKTSMALELAKEIMSSHFPDWYKRFPDCSVSPSYLTSSSQMRWNATTFPDAIDLQNLTPEELLELLFP